MASAIKNSIKNSIDNLIKFILLQDPVKIAIGFALGMAFSKIGLSIISDFVNPIVHLKISEFKFKNIIEQIITLFIFLLILYYFVIIPINNLKEKYNIDMKTAMCPYCKSLINPNATKCSSCTSQLNPNWVENKEIVI